MLGSMGVPVKVEVNGQHVWLCCPGCKPQLEGNPAKYLAKFDR
jgi:Cu(I)/Ag(I) efflux system membrane fusion protein